MSRRLTRARKMVNGKDPRCAPSVTHKEKGAPEVGPKTSMRSSGNSHSFLVTFLADPQGPKTNHSEWSVRLRDQEPRSGRFRLQHRTSREYGAPQKNYFASPLWCYTKVWSLFQVCGRFIRPDPHRCSRPLRNAAERQTVIRLSVKEARDADPSKGY
jgi:hypothetical protein